MTDPVRSVGAGWASSNAGRVEEVHARSTRIAGFSILRIGASQTAGVTGKTLLLHWVLNESSCWAIGHTGAIEEDRVRRVTLITALTL